MRHFLIIAALLLAAAPITPAHADNDKVVFYEDPVFKPLNEGDEHPMSDLIKLSEGGDIRAQFILGDLYAKGKGGLVKNTQKAKHWFNQSAMNGYGASFIRLGALAKREGDLAQAYSWYDLGSSLASGKDARYSSKARDALNVSAEDEDKADALSTAWRKERSAALDAKAQTEKAKRAEEKTIEAAKKAAEQAADIHADTPKKAAKKAASVSAIDDASAQPAPKERKYND